MKYETIQQVLVPISVSPKHFYRVFHEHIELTIWESEAFHKKTKKNQEQNVTSS